MPGAEVRRPYAPVSDPAGPAVALRHDVLRAARARAVDVGRVAAGLSRVSSLWAAAALVALMALQLAPGAGRALQAAGADVVAGWLVHLVLVCLAVDALRGALPRAVALVPAVVYLAYALAVREQGVQVGLVSEQLRQGNPGRLLPFDPARHSLVTDRADVFAATHDIPVVYSRAASYVDEGYVSWRLIEKARFPRRPGDHAPGIQALSVEVDGAPRPNLVELRVPERPPHTLVTVAVRDQPGEGWKDWNIGFVATSLAIDGRVLGTFRSGYVRRLPPFPFLTIGCNFSRQTQKRDCHVELATERTPFESRPDSVDLALYPDPVAIMAGIRRLAWDGRTAAPAPGLRGGPLAPPGEDDAFAALEATVRGAATDLSFATAALVARNPARLAPFAGPMARRFVDLGRSEAGGAPGRIGQLRFLAAGLAALRPADLAAVADDLSGLARDERRIREQYPLLYVRLADTGPRLYSTYRDAFLKGDATPRDRMLAALAICRLGQADSELLAAIQAEWTRLETGEAGDAYRSALFVALVRLGRIGGARGPHGAGPTATADWYEAVLDGHGRTDVGPNNCMPVEWPEDGFVPDASAPRLKWRNGHYAADG